jgi:hypothetical protein
MPTRSGLYIFAALLSFPLFSSIGHAQQAPSCQFVSFKVTLNANDNYERELGGGLLFRVRSENEPGWFVDIVPAEANTKDYIYPVNLPLRFNANQTLGPGYGETAKSSLSHPHEMNFLLDRSDYDRISSLIPRVLSDPDRALADYTNAVDNARKGWVRITISSYKTDPKTDSKTDSKTNSETNLKTGALTHIKLRVGITTPPDFQFAPGLNPWPAPCHR